MVPGSIPGRPTKESVPPRRNAFFLVYFPGMDFAFSWEFPAALIGAAAVTLAAGTVVWAVARSSHGPSRGELLSLGLLAAIGLWTWNARAAMAKRFFPDDSGGVEESVAEHMRAYGDCAAYIVRIGKGHDDGAVCTVDVPSRRGRYVAPLPPRAGQESPCDLLPMPEIRKWTFVVGSVRDWCDTQP